MLAMKFAGKKEAANLTVRFAVALSQSFQTSSEFMQPGVDIWYMTENMAAQFFQKITLNASAGGHKSCARTSYQKKAVEIRLKKTKQC